MKETINSTSANETDEQIKNIGSLLSGDAWLLIGGVVLLVAGFFLPSKTIGEIVRVLDLRLWPIWYFPLVSLLVVFAFFWIRFYCKWDDYSFDEQTTALRFVRFSVFCAILIVASFVISIGKLYLPLRAPLYFWFVNGSFSLAGTLTILALLGVTGVFLWLLKDWISSMRS